MAGSNTSLPQRAWYSYLLTPWSVQKHTQATNWNSQAIFLKTKIFSFITVGATISNGDLGSSARTPGTVHCGGVCCCTEVQNVGCAGVSYAIASVPIRCPARVNLQGVWATGHNIQDLYLAGILHMHLKWRCSGLQISMNVTFPHCYNSCTSLLHISVQWVQAWIHWQQWPWRTFLSHCTDM